MADGLTKLRGARGLVGEVCSDVGREERERERGGGKSERNYCFFLLVG